MASPKVSKTIHLPTIGIITPNAQGQVQPEAAEIFSDRVNVITRGINVEQLSLSGYQAALSRLPAAIDQLVGEGADAIVINGTSLSFAFGRNAHDKMVSNIASRTGLPVTTMAASLVDGLKALDARTVVLATAYDEHVTELLADFLETHHIGARVGECLGIVDNAKLRSLTSKDIVELALRAAKGRVMDALVVSCGNLRTIPLTAELEDSLGIPVVSSALVGVWGALRIVNSLEPVHGAGRLFARVV